MKLTYAPLVSDARGRFEGCVFSSWKGVSLLRRFQKPANPASTTQTYVRLVFRNCTKHYVVQGALQRAAWTSFASGKKFLGRNILIARNVPLLDGLTDLDDFVFVPGDASTLAPLTLALTAGSGQITCDVTTPTAPSGWTLASVVCVAVMNKEWRVARTYADVTPTEGEDTSSPYQVVLTGLTASQLYEVGAFIKWTAPDGTTRYSACINDRDTPT